MNVRPSRARPLGGRNQLIAVAASQVVGQLSLLAVTPYLTRHYESNVIGTYQLTLSAALVLTPLATLRADLVIPGPVGADRVRRLRKWATWSTLAVTGLLGVAAAFAWAANASVTELMLSCALIAVTSFSAVDSALLIRNGYIWRVATRNVIGGALGAALQVAFAPFENAILALGGALVAGRLVALLVSIRPHSSQDPTEIPRGLAEKAGSGRELLASVASGTVSTAGANLPLFALAFTEDTNTLGQLAVGARLSSAPLSILGLALSQVVVVGFGRGLRNHPVLASRLFRRWCAWFSGFSVIAAGAIAGFGTWGNELLLGAGWSEAGRMAVILALSGAAQLAVVPFLAIYAMIGHANDLAKLQVKRVAGLGVVLLTSSLAGLPVLVTLFLYAVSSAALYALLAVELDRLLVDFARKPSH